jgi:hypothetical protein
MKYSLSSSFSRWVLGLFLAVLALTVLGRAVAVTGAIGSSTLYCSSTMHRLQLIHMLSLYLSHQIVERCFGIR